MANAGTFIKGEKKRRQGERGPGKATLEFKQAVNKLLEFAAPKMVDWLSKVADGIPEHDIPPNPEKALAIIDKLGEYGYSKLSRIEHVGDPEQPLKHVFTWKQD